MKVDLSMHGEICESAAESMNWNAAREETSAERAPASPAKSYFTLHIKTAMIDRSKLFCYLGKYVSNFKGEIENI